MDTADRDTPRSFAISRESRPRCISPEVAAGSAETLKAIQEARLSRDTRARFARAAALLRSGNPAAALIEFDDLVAAPGSHPGAALGRGLALHALGRREDALAAFRQITQADPLAWKAWGSVADITRDEAERVQAINAAAGALTHLTGASDASLALVRAAAKALISARRPDEALALLTQLPPVRGGPLHGLDLARAYYHCGRFAEAFSVAAHALQDDGHQSSGQAAETVFEPEVAVRVLIEVLDILSAAGVTAFLTAGTLLGFHRTSGPLAHDRDIDIGVFRDPGGGPDIAGILRRHPDILLPRLARPGARYFGLRHRGVAIDIFVHDQRDGGLVCGLSDLAGDIQWRFTPFSAESKEYCGRRWDAPDNAERFLAETYGPGWKIPDKGFASAVSSPALHLTDIHARACHAALRAHSAFSIGDRAKAAALLRQSPLPLPAGAGRDLPLDDGSRTDPEI
jgi:tetratricopeptide (TPR) repeat protein